jgi:hypothetical protein
VLLFISFRNLLKPAAQDVPVGRSIEELFILSTLSYFFSCWLLPSGLLLPPAGRCNTYSIALMHQSRVGTCHIITELLFPCLPVKKWVALIVAYFVHFLFPFLPEFFLAVINAHGTELPEAISSTSVEIHVTSGRVVTSA